MVAAASSSNQITRLLRFVDSSNQIHYGVPVDDNIKGYRKDVTEAYIVDTKNSNDIYATISSGNYTVNRNNRVSIKQLLSPVEPRNIYGIGLNYAKHAIESKMDLPSYPVVFMKNTSSITGSGKGNDIVIPKQCMYTDQIDYEGELCVIIGKECKNVSERDALDYVFGFTIAHDVSSRDWQLNKERSGTQWTYSKCFDTFCPLGPYITLRDPLMQQYDIQKLQIETYLNNEKLQDMSTSDMIFSVRKIISFLSQGTTLAPGTIILTGTPEGVGMKREPPIWLKKGDHVEISITGLGTLINDVVDEK